MEKTFPELFHADGKGRTRRWTLRVTQREECAHITRTYGVEGGKQTTVETIVTSGKNKGKANETSVWEQAIKQATAVFDKQMTLGYAANGSTSASRPVVKPMLAHTYLDTSGKPIKNKDVHVRTPFYMQPKLDGVRMLVGKHLDGTSVVMSRTGKPMYNMEHITDEIIPRLANGEFIDGENFTFDLSFEDITGICRTSTSGHAVHTRCKAITFHAFDTFHLKHMNRPFVERHERLCGITNGATHTVCVDTVSVKSKDAIIGMLEMYLEKGYEGGMIRNTDGVYKIDARSNDLQKVKHFVTDEFTIVGHMEADGRDKGTVIWICGSGAGTFKVRPKGSLESRRAWLRDAASYVGKPLTVQYQNMTGNGFPRFPVGIAIRDYE